MVKYFFADFFFLHFDISSFVLCSFEAMNEQEQLLLLTLVFLFFPFNSYFCHCFRQEMEHSKCILEACFVQAQPEGGSEMPNHTDPF